MGARRVTKILAGIGAISLVGLLVGGVVFAISVHHGFSARDEPSWLETRLARGARSWAVPARAKQLVNPAPATSGVLADARAHWADHCASCHSNDGRGDTPMGRSLYPKAPDLRAPLTQELSDGELYYIIQNGIRLSGMPAWGEAVDDDKDSWGLVRFIRHLPRLTPAEIEDMKKLNPKSSHEWHEQQEEEQFLQSDDEPATEQHDKRSHHN